MNSNCDGTSVDLKTFAQTHLPGLNQDEARNNLIVFIISSAADQPRSNLRFWSFGDDGACAVQSPGWPVVLGDLSEAQCAELAAQTNGLDYPAVMGPDETAIWFKDQATRLGRKFQQPMRQQVYSITEPPVFPGCKGRAGPVTQQEASLLADWKIKFHHEAVPHDRAPDRDQLEKSATSDSNLFWRVDGNPVSLAVIARRTQNSMSINSVYTPPEFRSRGYAGAVTATLVNQAFKEGKATACLFVNMDNPSSTRCYQKIGFRPHCRFNYYLVE